MAAVGAEVKKSAFSLSVLACRGVKRINSYVASMGQSDTSLAQRYIRCRSWMQMTPRAQDGGTFLVRHQQVCDGLSIFQSHISGASLRSQTSPERFPQNLSKEFVFFLRGRNSQKSLKATARSPLAHVGLTEKRGTTRQTDRQVTWELRFRGSMCSPA